jgi:hypothetical protein
MQVGRVPSRTFTSADGICPQAQKIECSTMTQSTSMRHFFDMTVDMKSKGKEADD